jgi:hypothetical protein
LRDSYSDLVSPVTLSDVMLKVLLMIFVMYMVVSVIAKKHNEDGNIKKKAEFSIVAEWNESRDTNINCDVDLWVRNPDGQLVYWRMKENALMNIERDDIGLRNDSFINPNGETITNDEDAEYWYLRGIVAGEYTVNLHLYACSQIDKFISYRKTPLPAPMPVKVTLRKLNPRDQIIHTQSVELTHIWQESTAFNFTITAAGDVTSVTHIPMKFFSQEIVP